MLNNRKILSMRGDIIKGSSKEIDFQLHITSFFSETVNDLGIRPHLYF